VTQSQSAAVKGKRGSDALRDPATNKSTAFTEAEREGLGLTQVRPADRISLIAGAPPFKRAEPHGPKLSALRAGQPYG